MSEMAYREIYCPAHFGNSYEVMAPYEMKEMLQEAKFWGFNAYGDWLDAADLKDPHNNPRNEYLLPQALWDRKLDSFRIAQELEMKTDLVVTPNHVYINQLASDLAADTNDKMIGQLICPSKPKAREIILSNHRRLFNDLRSLGVSLDSISACPYDYGGCNCSSCKPWIITFGKLIADVCMIAREYFPNVKARLIGWWWDKEEHDQFKEWADREQPGLFVSLAAHIPYGETRPNPAIVLPEGCDLHAFVHIGYADKAQPLDVYGAWGPTIAPKRLPTTVYELNDIGCTGYMAYSEGLFDDMNKALLGGISSGKHDDMPSVLAAYAERYFRAGKEESRAWVRWLVQWGEPFSVDTYAARKEFDRLANGVRPGWRLAQLEAKLRIFEANAEVTEGKEWDKKRLEAADRFFLERDKLLRGIWGLGPTRQELNPRFHPPTWYSDWPKRLSSPKSSVDNER